MRHFTPEIPVLTAANAVGNGDTVLDVSSYDYIVISMHTANSANLTVKVQGSIADSPPTWADAQSITNRYDYIQLIDLEDNSKIDGDTGFAPAGTDDHRLFQVNVNGLKWLNLRVTARSAGDVTAHVRMFTEN